MRTREHPHLNVKRAILLILGLVVTAAAFVILQIVVSHHHAPTTATTLPSSSFSSSLDCRHSGVVLTYDNHGLNDGAGAQVQRILSLYLIAKRLPGVGYLHSPIAKVIYQGLDALTGNASIPGYESRWNAAFALPSFGTGGCFGATSDDDGNNDTTTCAHVYQRSLPSLEFVRNLQRQACALGGGGVKSQRHHIVLHATFAHEVTDVHPEILDMSGQVFYELLPWIPRGGGGGVAGGPPGSASAEATDLPLSLRHRPLRIAIHVRRGDLHFRQQHRVLPNAYYIAVARELARILDDELNLPWQLDVYTEALLNKQDNEEQQQHPITIIAPNQVGLEPHEFSRAIELRPDHSLIEDFQAHLKNARLRVNGDALDTLKALVAADVLVLSPSSFSYVAGLLRPPGQVLVIYHPFWHAPRSDWFRMSQFDQGADDDDGLSRKDVQRLRAKIAREFEHNWRGA